MRPFPLLQTCEAVSGHEAGTGVVQGWAESSGVFGWEEGTSLLVGRADAWERDDGAYTPLSNRRPRGRKPSGFWGIWASLSSTAIKRQEWGRPEVPARFFFFLNKLTMPFLAFLFLRVSVLESINTRGF